MSSEVMVIAMLLLALIVVTIGSQAAIWYLEDSISGFWLTELVFFNLPIHFWISGQFLPLWFIILGIVFNMWMDRNEIQRMEGIIRFRAAGRTKEEMKKP